ncbi:MAG: DUF4249 domain-containing protein [Bacteroidales bacterium]|jgi:hypothetical protein|nr:DUF4249 domain-containing protein [Bacteroidales bacterium]
MKFILKNIFFTLSIALLFFSCQEEIDINLNDVESKIVIAAEITDSLSPNIVKISHTINFDEPNNFNGIANATVILSDDNSNSELLTMDSTGYYCVKSLQVIPEHTYYLSVSVNEQTYSAKCKMPTPAEIDTLIMRNYEYGNLNMRTPELSFKDKLGEKNFYRIKCFVNNELKYTSRPTDEDNDGKILTTTIFVDNPLDETNTLKAGDTIRIELYTITEEVWDYFRTIHNTSSSSPANPLSNIKNALGVFNVCGVRTREIIVE